MKVSRNTVFNNLIWRFAERVGAKGVSLVISIVLARLLTPEAYGNVALLSVFLTIFGVFVDSGLGNALIQKKEADDNDFTTVFFFNIVWCIVLYVILYIAAPYMARFYNNSSLTALTRAAGITILFSGVKNIQQAYVSRTMQFKKFFMATLGGTVFSGVIGTYLAYKGYGAWSLVVQNVANTGIDTIILWVTVKWRPKGKFQLTRLRILFSYGWKLLASSLLDTVYNNLRSLIIGKKYTSEDLAYYNKGQNWPGLIVNNVNSSIDSVLLPTMSMEQDDIVRVKQMTKRSISISVYVMAPLLLGLACISPTLVSIVLTDKWLPIVPYMQIFCITYIFYPVHTANLNAVKALGRSDLFLKLEIIKKIFGFVLLLSTMWFGPMAIACGMLIDDLGSQIINSWPNKKILNYSYFEQLKDMLPNILLAAIMAICISFIPTINLPTILTLILQIVIGAIIYILGSVVLKNTSFLYLWRIIQPILIRINKK